jgi:hypothetical protein
MPTVDQRQPREQAARLAGAGQRPGFAAVDDPDLPEKLDARFQAGRSARPPNVTFNAIYNASSTGRPA